MNKDVKVSIITVCLNSEKRIERTINSVIDLNMCVTSVILFHLSLTHRVKDKTRIEKNKMHNSNESI